MITARSDQKKKEKEEEKETCYFTIQVSIMKMILTSKYIIEKKK